MVNNFKHFRNRNTLFGVQKSSREDLIQIADISTECFPSPWSEALLLSLYNNPSGDIWHSNSLEKKQKIVSYVLLSIAQDEAEILSIGTLPNYQKQNIAQKMLLTVIDDLRNRYVKYLFLEVAENNIAAVKLYNKLGFRVLARRKGYYAFSQGQSQVDALVMRLEV